jgi:hypothetical protein
MVFAPGFWIWTDAPTPARNAFVRFRRRFLYQGGPARLHLTADSRYILFVNGRWLGHGPVRAWPAHWRYDTYDLEPWLQPGENVLAVLVRHEGEGNFQYLPGPPGLLAALELADQKLVTDATWQARPDPAFRSATPRISVQQGFEEQYDARLAEPWTALDFDDRDWPPAVPLRPAEDGWHRDLAPRGIPFLTQEPVLPQRVLSVEAVRSRPYRFTLNVRPYLTPDDRSSNFVLCHAYLATQVWSPQASEIVFLLPRAEAGWATAHKRPGPIRVNGQPVTAGRATLQPGWNSLVVSLHGLFHLLEFVIVLDGPPGLRFSAAGQEGGSPWAVVGPFDLTAEDLARAENHWDASLILVRPWVAGATAPAGEAFWAQGLVPPVVGAAFFQPVRAEDLLPDVFVQAYTDQVVATPVQVENAEALLAGAGWTVIQPPAPGSDVRLLLDFGQEVVGFQRLTIVAPAGTVVDGHNFEFIQPDGRFNFAEGMNNTFRYVCREGYQEYQTIVRRGFRYSYLILRDLRGPVRLGQVATVFSTYPQQRQGHFACSDALLTRIWEVGAHTLRCCAEDTYTDCPTYEQTHWVGDARNEALVDWVVNGDPRLWYRCLEQAGQSLERSPLVESHVPSAWQNILPAWSFLWLRSCREYLLFTGDREGARRLFPWVVRNIDGLCQHLNADGLFEIRAWNMFDWAPMDTPSRGVVTHQNCLAVHALRDAADLAAWLGEEAVAAEWRALADRLSAAINQHLWSAEREAYADCRRGAVLSTVFSQQTQTVAYLSGVATGERAERCRQLLHSPPPDFVRAGSPFFAFFLLEAYQREGRAQEFLDTIRRDWGFMIDMGATTFWEMWSGRQGRLTRSHCHGWSAAPTYFLSTFVLGVRPGGPGFRPVVVEPHPADLRWARGTVPTPGGPVQVRWENLPDRPFGLHIQAPPGWPVVVRLPRPGTATLNGQPVGETGELSS